MKPDLKVAIYDHHTWEGSDQFVLELNDYSVECVVLGAADKPRDYDFYVICDELATTKFPFFFPRAKRVALLKESPNITNTLNIRALRDNFDLVLTHSAKLLRDLENSKLVYFRSNWVQRDPNWSDSIEKSKLVSFVGNASRSSTPGYRFRQDVFDYLKESHSIDMFGIDSHYIEYKTQGLTDYRFSVAMENAKEDYYFTEKLIDCILQKTIPIYYGCPSIGDIFDADGILQFSSINELDDILNDLSVHLYNSKLAAVERNREILFEDSLSCFSDFWDSVTSTAIQSGNGNTRSVLNHSKYAAGIRFFLEKFRV